MSRRKAGCVPRRVELEPDQDDMEIPELIIDVKPEREAGALALEPRSPKDVSMPGLGTERRLDTAPSPFGTRSLWAPWIPLNPEPSDRQPWTDKHPDLLTCGRCQQTFPLEAIVAFMNHKKLGCQLFQGSGPISESKELKALSCLRCGRQFAGAWKLLRHAQWDHGLSIYQTESETPESPLLGLAEVAAAVSAVPAAGPAEDNKPPAVSSAARQSPTCLVCKKTLSSFSNLKVHMRSHTGERPYACDQCPYACAQSSKLKRHQRMHGLGPGSTRYKCPHCCVPFGLRATLDKHLLQSHPEMA